MKKGDIFIIAIILVIATALSFFTTYTKQVGFRQFVIVEDGVVKHKYTFDDDFKKTITIENSDHINTIRIENGTIKMVEANCPDQVCVKSRPISKNGEMIVCLPHKLYVKVLSPDENSEVDMIAS